MVICESTKDHFTTNYSDFEIFLCREVFFHRLFKKGNMIIKTAHSFFDFYQNHMTFWPLISTSSVRRDSRMLEVDFRRASVLTLLILYRFFGREGWMEFWKDKMSKNLSKSQWKIKEL